MGKVVIILISVVVIAVGGWLLLAGLSDDSNTNQAISNTTLNTSASTNTATTNPPVTNTDIETGTTVTEPELKEITADPPISLGPDLGAAPDFSLKDYNGNTVSLADFRGKPIVLNAWAAWCPFCVKELPDFASVQQELGDKITIISINRAESLSKAKSYTDDLDVTNDLTFLLDPSDSFYTDIGGFSMPETLLVDGSGIIRHHQRGPIDTNELKQLLNDNLGVQ